MNTSRQSNTRLAITLLSVATAIAACSQESMQSAPPAPSEEAPAKAPPPADPEHTKAVETWRKERVDRLTSDYGWLTLVGLHWLKDGENPVGSAEGSTVQLPGSVAAKVGTLTVSGEKLKFAAAKGVEVTHEGKAIKKLDLLSDVSDGGPTKLQVGTVRFFVIKRGDRLGVRVKDSQSEVRTGFKGIDYFPIHGGWKKMAKFEPHTEPKVLKIQNVLGDVEEENSPGALVFTDDQGTEQRLDVTGDPEGKMFVVFKDTTAGKETYGAGRFIYVGPVKDGQVELDFNQAYNPPCAFTAFSTCPLPPKQNRLAMRVEAGEKKYH